MTDLYDRLSDIACELSSANTQRAPSDDKIIAEHIIVALEKTRALMREVARGEAP